MSAEPLAPGFEILTYRLQERVGVSVWRADDTRSAGKSVALKILTRQLPKDALRREQIVRDVRLGAAIYHPFLVPIIDVIAAGDLLALVMEFVDAKSMSRKLGSKALDRNEFFNLAYQIADVLKFLEARNMVHANVNADSVLVTPAGQVKLAGLNALNLIGRREGSSSPVYQQKGNDTRSVAYMAPEQIAGQTVDSRADVFSMGVLFYEMATGSLPWTATEAPDLARAVVDAQPLSPRAVNPQIDGAVMNVIGRCLFKDPYRRHKDPRAVLEDIAKASPDSVRVANELAAKERTVLGAAAPKAESRGSILLLADLADYGPDAEARNRSAARLQQLVGEAVYLFDGQIVDSLAARVIAELPSVENALEAARKVEFDFSPEQQGKDILPLRVLLHAGDVVTTDGRVTGETIDKGFAAVDHLPPLKLFLSEDFAKRARGTIRVRDAGARGGVKLYEIAPAEPELKTVAVAESVDTNAEAVAESVPLPPVSNRRRNSFVIAGAGLLLLALGLAGIMLTRDRGEQQPVKPQQASIPRGPKIVALAPFSVEGAEPAMLERASAIRLAAIEILRRMPGIQVTDGAALATTFGATLRVGAAGPEIVPQTTGAQPVSGPPTPLTDSAAGVQAVVHWIASQTHIQPQTLNASALNPFADALLASSNNDNGKTESSLRAAVTADPAFLPAQAMAMKFFGDRGNDAEALAAAKQVMTLDPSNVDAARRVARGSLLGGDAAAAIGAYDVLLRTNKADAEALNTIARYAASVQDQQRFSATLTRIKTVAGSEHAVDEPDIVAASGNIDAAIDRYYDIETEVPNNPNLSLKIGRIAVLRRTFPVAELELKKLEQNDPSYGHRVLKAYLAAQKGARAEAQDELKAAFNASRPGDDYWTSAAEVYAMLGDDKAVIAALGKAVQRGEPTTTYVLNNRLFSYLASNPEYQKIRQALGQQQEAVRGALARIAM